jgi:hypothetical protein
MREYVRRKFGIGYWKAFMLRWMPERMFKDTHTPTSQRAQIGILALILIFSLVGLLWHPGLYLAMLLFTLFYFTALYFLVHLAFHDVTLIFIAPLLILLRAGALGFGLLWGFLFPRQANHVEVQPSQIDC